MLRAAIPLAFAAAGSLLRAVYCTLAQQLPFVSAHAERTSWHSVRERPVGGASLSMHAANQRLGPRLNSRSSIRKRWILRRGRCEFYEPVKNKASMGQPANS